MPVADESGRLRLIAAMAQSLQGRDGGPPPQRARGGFRGDGGSPYEFRDGAAGADDRLCEGSGDMRIGMLGSGQLGRLAGLNVPDGAAGVTFFGRGQGCPDEAVSPLSLLLEGAGRGVRLRSVNQDQEVV